MFNIAIEIVAGRCKHGRNGKQKGKFRCCPAIEAEDKPTLMVAPDREVPGIIASTWHRPIFNA